VGNGTHLSQRQIQLVQSTAAILMEKLLLSKEESISLISESLKEELSSSNITFEYLETNSKSYRISFIRNLVYRVEKKLENHRYLHPEEKRIAINSFVQLLHSSWDNE
jgi:hypothetical protein